MNYLHTVVQDVLRGEARHVGALESSSGYMVNYLHGPGRTEDCQSHLAAKYGITYMVQDVLRGEARHVGRDLVDGEPDVV